MPGWERWSIDEGCVCAETPVTGSVTVRLRELGRKGTSRKKGETEETSKGKTERWSKERNKRKDKCTSKFQTKTRREGLRDSEERGR